MILQILKTRFEENMYRHRDLVWAEIQTKLEQSPEKLHSLEAMENTGGEPDVIDYDLITNKYIFCDCSPESPKGRRSLCYDQEAWELRKEHKPKSNAITMATQMGVELLTEAYYLKLQNIGDFDLKTSSWIATPTEIRKLGGAIFGDKRFGRTFIYHNGAESYYAARGFRAMLKV
ncbi:MAG: DUF4256 domain-containing protein [Capnocytophaga sp.]|nr:DUF4256 domain-containing protein [Capnocytophaga sp.]